MYSFMSDGAEMFDGDWRKFKQWASTADDQTLATAIQGARGQLGQLGKMSVGDVRKFIIGADRGTQLAIQKAMGDGLRMIPGVSTGTARRMAGSGLAKGLGRVVPGLSVAGNVMDVADIVTGDESFANKAMDTTAMVVGGAIGSVGGPLGASLGASTGKMVSDGAQWLFGDKKSPQQRKMEEALRALQNGGIY